MAAKDVQIRLTRLPEELQAVVGLWNLCLPPSFTTTGGVLENYLHRDVNFDPGACLGAYDQGGRLVGWIIGRRWREEYHKVGRGDISREEQDSQYGVGMLFIHPEFRRRGIGTRLLTRLEDYFRSLHAGEYDHELKRVVSLGREPGRYFLPGVPEELEGALDFFAEFGYGASGFQTAIDVIGDITSYEEVPQDNQKLADLIEKNRRDGFRVVPFREELREAAIGFITGEFGQHWVWKVLNHVNDPGADLGELQLLVRETADSEPEFSGFALTATTKSLCTGPATLVQGGGDPKFGGLGPIGISESVRGRGLGAMLLHDALYHLKTKGVERVLIDWTGHGLLERFYGPAGFRLFRTYISASKPF
ncbi:MAG: GNAT family N-acetyltransferase [Promethearchaeota archaeon]